MKARNVLWVIAITFAFLWSFSHRNIIAAELEPISLADVQSVNQALDLASHWAEIGLLKGEGSAPRENLFRAEQYFDLAEQIMKKERAEYLLRKGWILSRRIGEDRNVARKMLKEGLELDPDNPRACYKVACMELDAYFASLPTHSERPQQEVRLPDGNIAHLEPIYHQYSPNRDNSQLEYAQKLLEKSIKLAPCLANSYYELGLIRAFKKDAPSVDCYVSVLKHRETIDMELLFYSPAMRDFIIKSALQSVKLHAPEKLKELGLEDGYAPSPTPSPAS